MIDAKDVIIKVFK